MIAALLLAGLWALDQTQTPARDTRAVSSTGSSSIRGVVTTDESRPRPLRRARVLVTGPGLPMGRAAITDDAGAFAIDALAPGRYSVSAVKDGFVTINYGAPGPMRPGTAVPIGTGETRDLALRLPRGAVITGVVTDVDGLPAQGVSVNAFASRLVGLAGDRRFAIVPGTIASLTDDRGIYRIYGLSAGEYIVGAQSQQRLAGLPSAEVRTMVQGMPAARATVMSPVYHPSATDPSRATRVTVRAGEERAGVDLQLQYVPLATVSGTVPLVNSGAPPVIIMARLDEVTGVNPTRSSRTEPDGRFTLTGVTPGRYILMSRSALPGGTFESASWSTAEIAVDGEDVTNVALAPVPRITIAGRIVFEGSRPPPELSGLTLPDLGIGRTMGNFQMPLPRVQLLADGRFAIEGAIPGVYRMGVTSSRPLQGLRGPIGSWWLKSIVVDGRDILDAPLEFRDSTDQAVVTFSDSASELSGVVRDAAGAAIGDVPVVVFSADRRSWFFNSRRIASVRTDALGRYTIRNLAPGEYRAVATFDVEQNEWFEASTLDRLLPAAQAIPIAGPERYVRDLVVR